MKHVNDIGLEGFYDDGGWKFLNMQGSSDEEEGEGDNESEFAPSGSDSAEEESDEDSEGSDFVDSDEGSFKKAGARAFRDGFEKAGPVLLEPVMKVLIRVPTDDAGTIFSDITSQRRGHVLELEGSIVRDGIFAEAEPIRRERLQLWRVLALLQRLG